VEIKEYKGKLALVQPNKVTNARYSFTEREENILTLIIDSIQKHMTKEQFIQTDLFNQPVITIDTKEFGDKSKAKYWKAALSMTKKGFDFEYTNKNGRTEDVAGVLVTTVRNERETSKIYVTINQWAIPYLIYVGKGTGFTAFNKTTAIKLRGEYTKRLYKLCKRWQNKGGFAMSLEEFREMLSLETKYSKLKDLKLRVLDTARERMMQDADIYFNYSLSKIGGSRSYNFIKFIIEGNNKVLKPKEKTEMYTFVFNILSWTYPINENSRAQDMCNKLAENPDELALMYKKMKRLKNEYDAGEQELIDVQKLTKFIVKEDFNF